MNIETIKPYIIYDCISGSHAYGLNNENSDIDKRGIFILPTEELLKNNYTSQVSDSTNDTTYYEIGRFIELASNGNPNIIELLNVPEECVIYKDKLFDEYFTSDIIKSFITTKLKHTFSGYAFSQIKKAKGLNKKINWDKNKVKRKNVLDFCYIITDRENSIKLIKYLDLNQDINIENIGLAKVNNIPNLYSMYFLREGGGIISEDSNDVQLRSIPKNSKYLAYLRFDKNAYSQHCKDYREYEKWLSERNEHRYNANIKSKQNYDLKNMMHCKRLINTAKDISEGKGIIVRRPEREELLKIRNGLVPYEDIISEIEYEINIIKSNFDNIGLPKSVDSKIISELLLKIRLDNLNKKDSN